MTTLELQSAFILGLTGGLYINKHYFGSLEYMLWDDEYRLGVKAAKDIKNFEMEERRDRFLKDGTLWEKH